MTLPKISLTIEQLPGRIVVVNWRSTIDDTTYEETVTGNFAPHLHTAKTSADQRIIVGDIIRDTVDGAVASAVMTLSGIIAERDRLTKRHPATVEIRPNTGNAEDYTHACDAHLASALSHAVGTPTPTHYEVRPLGDGDRVDGEMPGCCWPSAKT